MNSLHKILVLFTDYVAQERWLLGLPVASAAGIGLYFSLPFEPPFFLIAITPLLLAACWLVRRFKPGLAVMGGILALTAGFNFAQLETHFSATPMIDYEDGPLQITGRLMRYETLPSGAELIVGHPVIGNWPADRTPVKIKVVMRDKTPGNIPPLGSMISLWSQLGPLSEPVIPGGPDERRSSYFKELGGIGWASTVPDIAQDIVPEPSWRDSVDLALENIRNLVLQHITARFPDETADVFLAYLNQKQLSLSDPAVKSLRTAGLSYLLSSLAVHVVVIGFLLYIPFCVLLAAVPWRSRFFHAGKAAAVTTFVLSMFYGVLIGAVPARFPSLLMVIAAIFILIRDDEIWTGKDGPLRLVMITAFLVMAAWPDVLLSPSFQISFAVIFSAVTTHPFLKKDGEEKTLKIYFSQQSFFQHIENILRTALMAAVAVVPFALYHFQSLNLYGFVANIAAIPIIGFWIMPCMLMAYVTAPFGLDGWFLQSAGNAIEMIVRISGVIAQLPFSVLSFPAMPLPLLVVASLGGLWFCLMRQDWRYIGLIAFFLALFYPLYVSQPDFIVSADGKEWAALLKDGRLAIFNSGHDSLEAMQWQHYLGRSSWIDVGDLPDTEHQVRCDEMGCIYHHGREILAMPTLDAAALEDCDHATVVVAPFVIRACAASKIIDDSQLWYHGAHAIYFKGDTMRTSHVRPRRGIRPWSPGWKHNMDKEFERTSMTFF